MNQKDIPKTLEDLENIEREWLTCQQISGILGANSYSIHVAAEQRPELLGFPVVVIGSRVKIPKRPFIKFMKEGIVSTE